VETLRRGVGVEVALGSFFLWERVPLLARVVAAATVLGVARMMGVAGVDTGCEVVGPDEERASKSDR
jgi:hypothetical protein